MQDREREKALQKSPRWMDSYWGTPHTAVCQQRRLEFQSTSTSKDNRQQNQRENEKQRRVKATVAQTTAATPATREKPKTTKRATPHKNKTSDATSAERAVDHADGDHKSQRQKPVEQIIGVHNPNDDASITFSLPLEFLGPLDTGMNSNQVVPLQRIGSGDDDRWWCTCGRWTWVTDKGGREKRQLACVPGRSKENARERTGELYALTPFPLSTRLILTSAVAVKGEIIFFRHFKSFPTHDAAAKRRVDNARRTSGNG